MAIMQLATSLIMLSVILHQHQTMAQLLGGTDISCDYPANRYGEPAELDLFEYIPYEEEIARKVGECLNVFCINGTVQVKYSFRSSSCDKPTNDEQWITYIENAHERDGPLQWRWQVPARIWELIKNMPNSKITIPTTLAASSTTSLASTTTRRSPSVPTSTTTTSRPSTTTTRSSTSRLSTIIRSTSTTTTSKPSTVNPKSAARAAKPQNDGPKPYVPKVHNFRSSNPKWTKDLSAQEIDYDELDTRPAYPRVQLRNSPEPGAVDEEEVTEETTDEVIEETTTTPRPPSRISTTPKARPTPSTTTRTSRVQLRHSSTIPPPIQHNYLDDGVRVEASTHEEVPLTDSYTKFLMVTLYVVSMIAALYAIIVIITVMGYAAMKTCSHTAEPQRTPADPVDKWIFSLETL